MERTRSGTVSASAFEPSTVALSAESPGMVVAAHPELITQIMSTRVLD